MNPGLLSRFGVELEQDRLVLKTTGPMPVEAVRYLEGHLERLNRFKVVGTYRGARSVSIYDPPLPSLAGVRGLAGRLERVFLKRRFPACATLAVTYACQCDCEHCSCAANVRPGPPLSTAQWKRVIDETIDLGATSIIFTGGEPLLRRDIVELVEHVDKDRATVVIFTNGERLTHEMAHRLAQAGLYAVFVSLDSPAPEEHDRLRRRPGLFDRVAEGISQLKAESLIVGLSIYLTHQKFAAGELDRYLDLGRELGVGEICQFDAVPTGRLFGQMGILLTEQDRAAIRQRALECFKDPSYPSLTAQSLVNSQQSMGCFAAFNQFYMTAYGEICPCDFTPLSFGSVLEESVAQIWDRMTHHPLWCRRHAECRMQSPDFRARTVDRIPPGTPMPCPVELLDRSEEKAAL